MNNNEDEIRNNNEVNNNNNNNVNGNNNSTNNHVIQVNNSNSAENNNDDVEDPLYRQKMIVLITADLIPASAMVNKIYKIFSLHLHLVPLNSHLNFVSQVLI
jgi:hypothetical protein